MGTTESVHGVNVVHWNPRRGIGSGWLGRRLTLGRRYNNFGDLLGPQIVSALIQKQRFPAPKPTQKRLVSVGSVLHFARTNDTVWGTGLNGKVPVDLHAFAHLDVRATRGPKTRDFLVQRGLDVPGVFGDPALLMPVLRPDLGELARRPNRGGTLLVPNLHDMAGEPLDELGVVLDPTSPVEDCLHAIVSSELVISSSLHGIVIAEAFGIPAIMVKSPNENPFKYEDYFEGTGRTGAVPTSSTFRDAVSDGTPTPELSWDPAPLLDAFPWDLWSSTPPLARAS